MGLADSIKKFFTKDEEPKLNSADELKQILLDFRVFNHESQEIERQNTSYEASLRRNLQSLMREGSGQ